MDKIEKMQEVFTPEEIALRLTETWASSECGCIDEVLYAYDEALKHVKGEINESMN